MIICIQLLDKLSYEHLLGSLFRISWEKFISWEQVPYHKAYKRNYASNFTNTNQEYASQHRKEDNSYFWLNYWTRMSPRIYFKQLIKTRSIPCPSVVSILRIIGSRVGSMLTKRWGNLLTDSKIVLMARKQPTAAKAPGSSASSSASAVFIHLQNASA